jgi:ATP-dependent DNA ligase
LILNAIAFLARQEQPGEEFMIGGYTYGDLFDALILGYYDSGKLLYVSKVRNGFVPHLRRQVAGRFKGLETATPI